MQATETLSGLELGSTARRRWWRQWPAWVGYAAACWSLAYAALGAYWIRGGAGFPFGVGYDAGARLSALARATPQSTGPAIIALGVLATVVAWEMALGVGRGVWRGLMLAFAWTLAVGLTLVIPDFRILVLVAYAPILLLGAPFGWPPGVRFFDAVPWPLINQLVCMTGGILWAATALAYQRLTRGGCPHCGRSVIAPPWATTACAARWGRAAVAIAVIVPIVYAITRWAWALGFPLGISETFFREGQETGLWWRGAALATLALVGALLTLGLARPWGERFPRWVPFLGGARVPPMLAIAPAVFVALIVTTAGLMFVRVALAGDFTLGTHAVTFSENWAALWPELLWPIWGLALGVAALAYYYRTRGRCLHCGRT